MFSALVRDNSDSGALWTERVIIREISARTKSVYVPQRLNESFLLVTDHLKSRMSISEDQMDSPPLQHGQPCLWASRPLTAEEERLCQYNQLDHEEEPEDAVLVASGVLEELLSQAKREPPSQDWESHLEGL